MTVSLLDLSSGFVGAARREQLYQRFGLDCICSCCAAAAGSPLLEAERAQLGAVGPELRDAWGWTYGQLEALAGVGYLLVFGVASVVAGLLAAPAEHRTTPSSS